MDQDVKTLHDYLSVVGRRKSQMLWAGLLILAASLAVAFGLPPVYRSTGTILIEQQEIPVELVRSTVTSYADEREIGRMTGVGTGLVAPLTKTTAFTLGANENEVICNGSASITATLPSASSWVGRRVRVKTIAAYTVISASSNVKPLDTDTAGTAILAATAGKWAEMVSDGSNWIIMAAN